MHTPAARLEHHSFTARFNRAMEMNIRRKDVEISHIAGDMEFSLYGREGSALTEQVSQLKYLGRTLYHTYDDWMEI